MNDKELVGLLFDLWETCEKEYKKRYDDVVHIDVVKTVFDRAAHHFIIKDIEISPKHTPAAPKERRAEPATQRQLDKIADMGGDTLDSWTKEEASKWIDKNKDW